MLLLGKFGNLPRWLTPCLQKATVLFLLRVSFSMKCQKFLLFNLLLSFKCPLRLGEKLSIFQGKYKPNENHSVWILKRHNPPCPPQQNKTNRTTTVKF